MSFFAKALTGTTWLMFSRLLVLAAGLASVVVVSRALGPSAFGQLSYSLALAAIIAPFGEFGLNAIVVKALVNSPAKEGQILGSAAFLRLTATIVALLVGVMVSLIFRQGDDAARWFVIILLSAEVVRTYAVCSYSFEAQRRFAPIALANVAISFAFAGFKIVAVGAGVSLTNLVGIYALEIASYGPVFYILYRYQGRTDAGFRVEFKWVKNLGKRSIFLAGSGILAIMNLKIDQVMLGELQSNADVGIYAAAVRISEFWYFIPALVMTVVFPDLIKLGEISRARYMLLNQRLLDGFVVISAVAFVVVFYWSDTIIGIFYGADFSASAAVLSIHIWGGVFVAVRAVASKWLVAEDIYGMSLISHGVGAVGNVIFNLVLIPQYGVLGAAVATVGSYALSGYLLFFFHRKTFPLARMMTWSFLVPLRLPSIIYGVVRDRRTLSIHSDMISGSGGPHK